MMIIPAITTTRMTFVKHDVEAGLFPVQRQRAEAEARRWWDVTSAKAHVNTLRDDLDLIWMKALQQEEAQGAKALVALRRTGEEKRQLKRLLPVAANHALVIKVVQKLQHVSQLQKAQLRKLYVALQKVFLLRVGHAQKNQDVVLHR
jgi:hypothetical protein